MSVSLCLYLYVLYFLFFVHASNEFLQSCYRTRAVTAATLRLFLTASFQISHNVPQVSIQPLIICLFAFLTETLNCPDEYHKRYGRISKPHINYNVE